MPYIHTHKGVWFYDTVYKFLTFGCCIQDFEKTFNGYLDQVIPAVLKELRNNLEISQVLEFV